MDKKNSKTKGILYIFLVLLIVISTIPIPAIAGIIGNDQDDGGTYEFPNKTIYDEATVGPYRGESDKVDFNVNAAELNLGNITAMIDARTDDLDNFYGIVLWLYRQESYITVKENNGGKASYYFNTPSIQMSIMNYLFGMHPGGVVYTQQDYKTSDESEQTTASRKYGYQFPISMYEGENPACYLDLTMIVGDAIKNPINTVKIGFGSLLEDTISRWTNLFGGFEVDINNQIIPIQPNDIEYIGYNTKDYKDTEGEYLEELADYLSRHWKKAKEENQAPIFIGDGLLAPSIYGDGVILSEEELEQDPLDGKLILNNIINRAQSSSTQVLDAFGTATETEDDPFPRASVIRNMPYILELMSPASREYMNNITDPRVTRFIESGGYINIYSRLKSKTSDDPNKSSRDTVVSASSSILEASSHMNSVTNMEILSDMGVGIQTLLDDTMGATIGYILLIITLILLVIRAFKAISGFSSPREAITKVITSTLLAFLAFGILTNPVQFTNAVTDIATKIMSMSSYTLNSNDTFNELVGDGASDKDIADMRFWYPSFSIWTLYVTNHTIGDEANKIDQSQFENGHNEYIVEFKGDNRYESGATLNGGKKIGLWSADYLDTMYSERDRDAYRTVDHFMAPVIKQTSSDGSFTVSDNEFYNGYMYSDISPLFVVLSFIVFVFVLIKFLVFLELVLDLLLFVINVIQGALGGKAGFKASLTALVQDIIKIIIYDTIITLLCFIISVANNETVLGYTFMEILLCVAYVFALKGQRLGFMAPRILTRLVEETTGRNGFVNKFKSIRVGLDSKAYAESFNLNAINREIMDLDGKKKSSTQYERKIKRINSRNAKRADNQRKKNEKQRIKNEKKRSRNG